MKKEKNPLAGSRKKLDRIDRKITALFAERMAVVRDIAAIKQENGLPVTDRTREEEKLAAVSEGLDEPMAGYARSLFEKIMELSRDYQDKLK